MACKAHEQQLQIGWWIYSFAKSWLPFFLLPRGLRTWFIFSIQLRSWACFSISLAKKPYSSLFEDLFIERSSFFSTAAEIRSTSPIPSRSAVCLRVSLAGRRRQNRIAGNCGGSFIVRPRQCALQAISLSVPCCLRALGRTLAGLSELATAHEFAGLPEC